MVGDARTSKLNDAEDDAIVIQNLLDSKEDFFLFIFPIDNKVAPKAATFRNDAMI